MNDRSKRQARPEYSPAADTRCVMRRTSAALFLIGVATFASLNAPQSILFAIGQDLGLKPARAALVTTASTAGLAAGVLPWVFVSDRVGRYWALTSSATLSAVTGLAVRALPTFETVLVGRVAEGMMLAGVPVTAITYARELLPTKYTARAAGFFVGAQPSEGGPGVSSPVHLQTPLVGAQGYSHRPDSRRLS
ncbi:MFS transporter [Rhodococcus hoagii]|nr:MFS transporter [Prescottella equi]